ncbi:metal-sensing transcriptional repressor [Sorangium sp. So ce1024]|uniref:metal-sensing transcriptional repressor n=1 Tax=Sorangium sp. So ce1024 TaxID=3133327 RepID=UPI003F10675D
MSTIEDRKHIARVRRTCGPTEAVERGLDGEHGCAEVLQTVASARGVLTRCPELARERARRGSCQSLRSAVAS